MKSRVLILSAFIVSMFFLTGCGGESTPIKNMEKASANIDSIADASENLNNADEAFTVLRGLTDELKSVRDASMTLDEKHRVKEPVVAKGETMEKDEQIEQDEDFKKDMEKFDKITDDISSSLKTINENIQPYKEEKEVKKMLDKVETIMITK